MESLDDRKRKRKKFLKNAIIGAGVLGAAGLGGYGLYKLGHVNGRIKERKSYQDFLDNNFLRTKENIRNLGTMVDIQSINLNSAERQVSDPDSFFSERSIENEDEIKRKRRNRVIRNLLIGAGIAAGAGALYHGIRSRNRKLNLLQDPRESMEEISDLSNKVSDNARKKFDPNISHRIESKIKTINDMGSDISDDLDLYKSKYKSTSKLLDQTRRDLDKYRGSLQSAILELNSQKDIINKYREGLKK